VTTQKAIYFLNDLISHWPTENVRNKVSARHAKARGLPQGEHAKAPAPQTKNSNSGATDSLTRECTVASVARFADEKELVEKHPLSF
jgi:hypothetical protein